MIDVLVTHYARRDLVGYNDAVVHCAERILEATAGDGVDYRLGVVYWTDDEALDADLRARLPPQVELHRGPNGVQPALMNEATRIARARGAEYFACLHNDVAPGRGWLRNIVADVRKAERTHGRGQVVASPRYLPYHWIDPSANARTAPVFWERVDPAREGKVLTADAMRSWCKAHGFRFDGRHVECPRSSSVTDDGHMLMMYCAAPEFFDAIGGCDESFTGLNYGDSDWGIRALMAGKKNLTSQGCLIGHVTGLTLFNPEVQRKLGYNTDRFVAKWGLAVFEEMQRGDIWVRLHREQRR